MYHTCNFLYHEMRYTYIKGDLSALNSSWKKADVEPGDQDGRGCVLVLIQMPRFVRDNGTHQTKGWTRGRKPARTKILVRIRLGISRVSLKGCLRFFHKCLTNVTRLLNIMGLFCKRALSKRLCSAKETYDFKEPSNGYSGADTSLKDIYVGRLDISRVSLMGWLRLLGS